MGINLYDKADYEKAISMLKEVLAYLQKIKSRENKENGKELANTPVS
jgi:hypothetical protein